MTPEERALVLLYEVLEVIDARDCTNLDRGREIIAAAIREAVKEEREACAALCMQMYTDARDFGAMDVSANMVSAAQAIRARGMVGGAGIEPATTRV